LTFVIFSNQPFDQKLKTNKWQIATRLAKKGHKVIFVDPPLRIKAFKSFLKREVGISNLLGKPIKRAENLYLLKLFRPAIAFNISKTTPLLDNWFSKALAKRIKLLAGKDYILWIYHVGFPNLLNTLNYLNKPNPPTLIYDVVDEYTEFPEYQKHKKWMSLREEWISKKADICFSSSRTLYNKITIWNDNCYYLPNAGAWELFSVNPKKTPSDIKGIKKPLIGFSGALDEFKVDLGLLYDCAKFYSSYNFILIGPQRVSAKSDFRGASLESLPNVFLIGVKDYKDLPFYFYNFDSYIIPYRLNKYTMGVFPTKLFDSLASGLPTVVTALPSYKDYKKYIYYSFNKSDFIKNIRKSIEENSQNKIKERKKIAKENSWDKKVDNQINIINTFLKSNNA